jgi:hypothetical protein
VSGHGSVTALLLGTTRRPRKAPWRRAASRPTAGRTDGPGGAGRRPAAEGSHDAKFSASGGARRRGRAAPAAALDVRSSELRRHRLARPDRTAPVSVAFAFRPGALRDPVGRGPRIS